MALQKEGIQALLDQAQQIESEDSESYLIYLLERLQAAEGVKDLSTKDLIEVVEAQLILYRALLPYQEHQALALTDQKELLNHLNKLKDKLEQENTDESAKN